MTKYKDFAVEFKDGEQDDGGYIVAYASTFDREPDSYGDVVAKGAFTKSLEKHEAEDNPIQFLFGHRTDDPMYNIGTVISAEEDDRGLLIEAKFDPSNEKAQYARKLVREGRLKKLSFAYDVIDQAPVVLADGRKANELRELDIFEVSLVPIPANQHAEVVAVKADEPEAKEDEEAPKKESAATVVVDVIPRLVATKAGRVLSSKNEDDIKKAVALLNGVLSQLEAASNDSEEDPIEQKEGDPSAPEASEVGGKGAPEIDEEFIAKFKKYIDQKEN